MIQNIIHSVTILLFTTIAIQAQICPGTPGQVQWDAWSGLADDEFSELTALPYFPSRPEVSKTLFKLQAPSNYDNYFGSRIRGFIQVPNTTTATFNVTGNHRVMFYMSSDAYPDNKAVIANVPETTDQEQHDLFPEQTSTPIVLEANTPYYFELIHVDNWGSDHATVWWQTDLVDPVNWNIITAAYLLDIGCEDPICPQPGTPCDDGDPTTINDIEDGYCNCFGEKTTTNTCIGEKSKVTSYRYEGILGGDLNSLYEAPNFPGTPDFSEQLDQMGMIDENALDDTGHATQAFLTVPVSGNYKFNITGDDNTILFLSSDESMENRQAHQALVSGWTTTTEHDKYIYQSTSNIYLEKGNYYYIEINHKNGGGGSHYSAFWQTPFTEPGQWKRIPTIFLHDYTCEIACIPQGTLCDDGNPYTNNDMYDSNCECIGTPCSGPDCDSPLANYMKYDECSPTDQLDDREDNNWVSCQTSDNPNASRGTGHWIMYDLGERHELHQTQVWNYNVPGQTQIGFENVAIDYSEDGNNWSTLGAYTWPQASGGSGYSGFAGPHFNGTYARYVLITSLDAGGCRGLGKIAFTAVYCPLGGTPCDDGDEYTFNDKYNNDCECLGSLIDENECAEDNVVLGDSTLANIKKYSAVNQVSSISHIATNSKVSFVGGSSVILDVGFETDGSTLFLAAIDTCETVNGFVQQESSRQEYFQQLTLEQEEAKLSFLKVKDIPDSDLKEVLYYVKNPGSVKLFLKGLAGEQPYLLIDHEFSNPGVYRKQFPVTKLDVDSYEVVMQAKGKAYRKALRGSE